MDLSTIGTGLAQSAVGQQIDAGVLKALQNLDKNAAAELFASLGLGTAVDTRA
jgi:hypothetical protein